MFVKRQPVLVAIEITSRKVYPAVLKDKTGHAALSRRPRARDALFHHFDLLACCCVGRGREPPFALCATAPAAAC